MDGEDQVRNHTTSSSGERGASLVEYALLVALIAVVCVVAVTFLGDTADGGFSNAGSMLQHAGPGA